VRGESVSLDEIGQRRGFVCDVATEQDDKRNGIKSEMCIVVRQSVFLSVRQLLEERTALRTFLLRSVFLRRTTGLRQLPGDCV